MVGGVIIIDNNKFVLAFDAKSILLSVQSQTLNYRRYITYIMKQKSISIRDDQAEWIRETSLNLSWFVQKKLDKLMTKDQEKK